MSIPNAPSRDQAQNNGYVVAGPRKGDSIGGALRAAFGHPDAFIDEFDEFLMRIDIADRALGNC